ncbi:MAG TPA: sigma 54-interacting transcriptional regulator [Kofleriaceae bacterium]
MAETRATGYSLLIVGDDGAARHVALEAGAITIGRGEDCEVRLDDPSVSRRHATLTVGATLQITDLGSRNGVRVRGAALQAGASVDIAIDEVIAVGNYSLIVQRRAASSRAHRLWNHDYFEVRLEDECARAERFGWSFALVHVVVDGERSTAATRSIVATAVRSVDVVGAWGPGEYQILLPEVGVPEAEQILERIRVALAPQSTRVRGAVVAYPRDGRDSGTLAAAARATARGETTDDPSSPLVVDERMRNLHQLAVRIAISDLCVLLLGESGTGKEVLAEVIHRASPRASRPLIRLNCAALPEALLETELFGHEKGAFTGATTTKLGILESADGGTVLLDEVGELPPAIQAKLLRVLEADEVQRVGAIKPRAIDVRFLAATNRDLDAEIARGRFRADLYFRLNGVSIVIPALRDRVAEIEPLARRFIAAAAARTQQAEPTLDPEALALLRAYDWPGNIRELKNAIERAVLLQTEGVIEPSHLPVDKIRASVRPPEPAPPAPPSEPDDMTARIRAALELCGGNQTKAAQELGISRRTLVNRLNALGLPRPKKKSR